HDRTASQRRLGAQYVCEPEPAVLGQSHRRRSGSCVRHSHGAKSGRPVILRSIDCSDLSDSKKLDLAAGFAHLRVGRVVQDIYGGDRRLFSGGYQWTAGVLEINKIYLDVGKNFKADRWNVFWTIAIPGALPMILTGFKLGIGIGLVL